MSQRLISRLLIAGAAAVLLTLSVDLLNSASAIGGQRAIDELTSTHAFLFRSTIHALTEWAPAGAGLLAAAGLIRLVVRSINRCHDRQAAQRPRAARE